MRGLAPHWTYSTVEWSRKVASVHSELARATHFVLPDLPGVIDVTLQKEYYGATNPSTRIVTLVASQHNPATLEQWIEKRPSHESDILLVVGGNTKNSTSLSSVEAIQMAKSLTTSHVWAVANPNDKTSVTNVVNKVQAGATGIITQPLLCSHAMQVLEEYPRQDDISYLAGLSLPKTEKSLYFWLTLLEQPELVDDVLFRHHLHHFSSPQRDSLAWLQDELKTLATADIDGIHYMPLHNVVDLLTLLGDQ